MSNKVERAAGLRSGVRIPPQIARRALLETVGPSPDDALRWLDAVEIDALERAIAEAK